MIHHAEKQVRYDGLTVPGNPHHISPSCSDPRQKPLPSLWRRMKDLDPSLPGYETSANRCYHLESNWFLYFSVSYYCR